MRPSEIASAIETLITVKQPAFIWGAPGVGKSQIVAQLAAKHDLKLVDIRAVLLDPVDLRGIPRIDDEGKTAWCAPSFLPTEGNGILFLDELNTAPPLVQAACYQLILDRKLGEYELPEGWSIIAAGNRESDKAVTHRMPSALANRMVHLDFEADLDDWLLWADNNEVVPSLKAFLRFRPTLLHAFDPKKNAKAFPSPRSWEFVSTILAAKPSNSTIKALITGAVGEGAATEYLAFLTACDQLPSVEEVLTSPDTIELPDDPAVVYALCESVAREASDDVIPQIAVLAARLPIEFSVLLMRDSAATSPSIVETPSFANWAYANSDILV
ncbi:AAA family ATPase [Halodesulfovibrio spirochaetisodalis]|uniref:ATPase n=1 Tax=Halodesulfovibrio spirochaetisodalis TaxID=1560234 RepID=A0A1B7XMW6_9BACT|nr:MoxR family ATPase [Halodesulfovibrio spirochaetisodalis]OBQ56854.1 ATPase [Halodesulfovibrio spirochaetisodalis]